MYEDEHKYIANENLPADFSLDDILAEYKQQVPEQPEENESIAQRSKRIVMEALNQTVSQASLSSIEDLIDDAVQEEYENQPQPEPEEEEAQPEEEKPDELTEKDEELISQLERERQGTEESEPISQYRAQQLVDADEREEYAQRDFPEQEMPDADVNDERREKAKERFLSPVVALLALIAIKRGQRKKAENREPTVEDEDADLPEMDPERAAKLYSSQMGSLKMRGKLAALMSLVMVYLSFAYYSALPLTGALGRGISAVSLLLMVFELTVMVIGLDVITSGLMSLVRKKPGYDSLVAVSCIFTLLDAAVTAAMGGEGFGLPFCAVSAVSLTFSLWGSYFTCKGYKRTFRLLAMSKRLYAVTGERDIADSGVALLKSDRSTRGFVTRSEEADITEYVYSFLAPLIFALALILGLLASVAHGQGKAVIHCISVMLAASCAFSAAICFSLPFSITARRLFQSGAAISGWSGVRDIGKSRHVIITDSDVFPQGTVEIAGIRILEGAFTDKVISYTGSVIAASGCGLARPFSDLIRRNGYSINRVENFQPHDGGGMTAMVNGENVYVGNTGFMNLMGIRVPQKLSTKSSVFTAINGSLVGIFAINYKPVASVQEALALLLRSNREPIFAIRDFNITPMMIKTKFRMPTDIFQFPSYSERYRISGAQPDENSKIAAVISREGMGPLVDAADRGRRLFTAARTGVAISAAGSVLGLVLMFLLCWAGAFDSATASNALVFMLLWLIPSIVISWGLQR
jgi:hypothetical protein